MNLAARCREALSHIQTLKMELALQQRRANEAVQLQREQQQTRSLLYLDRELPSHLTSEPSPAETKENGRRIVPPTVSPRLVSSDDYEEDLDDDDHVEADVSSTSSEENVKDTGNKEQSVPYQENPQASLPLRPSMKVQELLEPQPPTSPVRERMPSSPIDIDEMEFDDSPVPSPVKSMSPSAQSLSPAGDDLLFTSSASPKLSRNDYNEGFPGDITAGFVRQHHIHHEPRLGRFQESNTDGDDDSSSVESSASDPPSPPEVGKIKIASKDARQNSDEENVDKMVGNNVSTDSSPSKAMTSLSSIDAFEASFQTKFPESFSPREDDKKGTTRAYDPFSSSPMRPDSMSFSKSILHENNTTSTGDIEKDIETTPLSLTSSKSTDSADTTGSTPPGSSIRERAAAAYRRSHGNRWATPEDPPGVDKTSTRKAGPLGSRALRLSTNTASPVTKSPHSLEKPMRSTPVLRQSPSSTPQKSTDVQKSEVFRTPSPVPSHQPLNGSSEPPRPEKSGFEAARSKYEKALIPRPDRVPSRIDTGDIPLTTKALSPDRVENLSPSHKIYGVPFNGVKARAELFTQMTSSPPSGSPMRESSSPISELPSDEEDGMIPMKSRAPKESITQEPVLRSGIRATLNQNEAWD